MTEKELRRKLKKILKELQPHGGFLRLSERVPLYTQYRFFQEILEHFETELSRENLDVKECD